jgi:hypothetical protein
VEEFNGLVSNGVNSNVGPFTFPESLAFSRIPHPPKKNLYYFITQKIPKNSCSDFLSAATLFSPVIFNL